MVPRSVWILLSCYFGIGSCLSDAELQVTVMFEDALGCQGGEDYEQGIYFAISKFIKHPHISENASHINGGSLHCSEVSRFHGLFQLAIAGEEAERAVMLLSQLANISTSIMVLGVLSPCGHDDDWVPPTAATSSTSNTLLIVLLATCAILLLLLTIIIPVALYKCYYLSREARFGKMEPAPLPAEEPRHGLPYEVAFPALDPVYIQKYDIATVPDRQDDDSSTQQGTNIMNQAANVSQVIDQTFKVSQTTANVSQTIDQTTNVSKTTDQVDNEAIQAAKVNQVMNQVDVTPSNAYPGYVEHTNYH